MGRLLRDRKISSIGVKRTQPQSRLSINKAKTAKGRHALTDKTNNRENNSPRKIILPSSVSTTRSRARSILSSGSENDSPGNCDLPERKVKIKRHTAALHGKIILPKRNALADKTNSSENESPAKNLNSRRKAKVQEDEKLADKSIHIENNACDKKPTTMTLRQRKIEEPSTENSFCEKLTRDGKSCNRRQIYSPRTIPKSKTRGFSCLELSSNKLSNSFVQLEDISELIKVHDGENKSAKKPIYQMISQDDIKIGTDLLPEDKIKLYEYEVDANSPKKVKAKRKRKPRKKKIRISDSDLSDEEGGVIVRSATKRLRTVATSSPVGKKADEGIIKKTSFANPNHSHALSPINISGQPEGSTPRNVKFAENLPSANSTPNTSEPPKKPVTHKSLRFSQKEISSPVAKIMPGRQIKKSIYINPSEFVQKSFSPDLSIASEISTTENSAANLLASPSQSLKQTKINSFFSTSARSGNNLTEMTNHNNSGLFDELPSHSNSETMSTTGASAAGQFITMRRKAMYHAKPRISGFERALAPDKPSKPMTVENCFGFDDDSDADENFIPPSVQYRSLPLSVSVRPGCSTPITAPQPTRICVRPVTQPVPKKAVKLAVSTPQATNRSPPRAARVLLAAASEHASQSPPMILSDPETLTPVTFGDEPSNFCKPARRSYQRTPKPKLDYAEVASDEDDEPLVVAKKTKKKGKQYLRKKKQEEDNWASSINRQFEEIDDVALVVE